MPVNKKEDELHGELKALLFCDSLLCTARSVTKIKNCTTKWKTNKHISSVFCSCTKAKFLTLFEAGMLLPNRCLLEAGAGHQTAEHMLVCLTNHQFVPISSLNLISRMLSVCLSEGWQFGTSVVGQENH